MSEQNSRDHGIEHEPALGTSKEGLDPSEVTAYYVLQNEKIHSKSQDELDPSESTAHRVLQNEKAGSDSQDETALHSVYNELAIFPQGTVHETDIHCDWPCDNCDYNLRGLTLGDPCPECGHVQVAAPARRNKPSYAMWLKSRIAGVSWAQTWLITWIAALLGGPWAVLTTLLNASFDAAAVVIWGPITEEVMKTAVIATLIEIRPHLFKSSVQIWVAGLASALAFSAIENFLYLSVLFPNSPASFIAFRWSVCVVLHVGCTAIVTVGLVGVWKRSVRHLQPPRISKGLPWLIGAILLHGGYNGVVTLMALSGYQF